VVVMSASVCVARSGWGVRTWRGAIPSAVVSCRGYGCRLRGILLVTNHRFYALAGLIGTRRDGSPLCANGLMLCWPGGL